MKIKDFESQIQIGDKLKILYGHYLTKEKEDGPIVYKFKGYQPCSKCKNWEGCPGEIILEEFNGSKYTEVACYRNKKANNIRLKIIESRFFSSKDDLFDI